MSKRKKNPKMPVLTTMDVVRASRKGSRAAELENSTGFIAKHKTHKSKKAYNRKKKVSLDE